jgi:hypothetical protein
MTTPASTRCARATALPRRLRRKPTLGLMPLADLTVALGADALQPEHGRAG